MTTRPHLTILALCIAGMLASGVPLVGVLLGADGWALTVWGGGLGVFVFAGVMAFGLNEGAQVWLRQKAEDLRRDQLANEAKDLANQQGWRALERAVTDAILATDDDEPEPRRDIEVAHWHVFLRRLVAAGNAYGWARDTLTDKTKPTWVLTQPAWNQGTDLLAQAGYLYKDGAGTRLLVAEADWTAARLWEKVTLPPGEPPAIAPPPYHNTTTPPNYGKTGAGAVVEGVVTGKG